MGSGAILPVAGQPAKGADPGFVQSPSNKLVSINASQIGPPSNLYIDVNDRFVLLLASDTSETVQWQARLLLPNGDIKQIGGTLSNGGTNYVVARSVTQLAEGFLLSICVGGATVNLRGRTFVAGYISRAVSAGFSEGSQLLFSDYIWTDVATGLNVMTAGWPAGRVQSPLEGPGSLLQRSGGAPAAGAEWSVVTHAGSRVRFVSVSAQLVTNANVANRIPRIQIVSGGLQVWQGPPSQAIPASTTAIISAGPGATLGAVADPLTVLIPLPGEPFYGAATTIRSNTTNLQAGDQWSNITVQTQEWLEM